MILNQTDFLSQITSLIEKKPKKCSTKVDFFFVLQVLSTNIVTTYGKAYGETSIGNEYFFEKVLFLPFPIKFISRIRKNLKLNNNKKKNYFYLFFLRKIDSKQSNVRSEKFQPRKKACNNRFRKKVGASEKWFLSEPWKRFARFFFTIVLLIIFFLRVTCLFVLMDSWGDSPTVPVRSDTERIHLCGSFLSLLRW